METSRHKTLLLLRHAKSAWDDEPEDRLRPLTSRGRRDALAVGELLADRGIEPDVVACSTAVRTRQTWERVVEGGAQAREVRYLDDIYAARVTDLIKVVRAMPETAQTVLLIGHQPGVGDLVDLLAVRAPNSEAWRRIDEKFPTSGLATLTFSGSWADAGEAQAELASFEVARGAPKESVS